MENMKLDMIDEMAPIGNQPRNKKITSFLRPNEYVIQDNNFINFQFQAFPDDAPHIDKSIYL